MIIVKVQGGLGNQLFQYALGRQLANMRHVTIAYDKSWYAEQSLRTYKLDQFHTNGRIATESEIQEFKRYRKKGRWIWFLYNLLIADESKYVREKSYDFDPNVFAINDNCYLDGIWISYKYFARIENIIRSELTPTHPLSEQHADFLHTIHGSNSVAIHVRRGDFVTDSKVVPIHGALSLSYYERAMEMITKQVAQPNFFVFSDDIDWARNNLKFMGSVRFVSDNRTMNDIEELTLMRACKHIIIANSTFSWWAAWLNTNPNKIVIAPQKWFRQDSRNTPDLIPPTWITIPNTHL